MATMAATDAAKAEEEAARDRTRPADTPAVSPWTSAPETFEQMEGPGVNASTMGPLFAQTGVRQTGRPQDMADWQTQAVASLPHDPMARVAVFARARFPELPIEHAMRRYGFTDDRIYYIDRDGVPKWEQAVLGTMIADPARAMASQAGSSMALAGAAAGGFVGGVPGAAVGAGLADIARQHLAARLADETMSLENRITHTAVEAGSGAAGRFIGDKASRMVGRAIGPYVAGPVVQHGIRWGANRGAFEVGRTIRNRWGEGSSLNEWPSLWSDAP